MLYEPAMHNIFTAGICTYTARKKFAVSGWHLNTGEKVITTGYSNLSDTEAPKIPTFQGSKNSDTVLG